MVRHPYRRDDDEPKDHGKLASYNALWDRYGRVVMTFVTAALSWVAIHVWEPIRKIPNIIAHEERSDSTDRVSTQQREMLIQKTDDLANIVTILVKMQCLQLDEIDRTKINLDCRDIPLPDEAALRRFNIQPRR